jgi:deoxyribonuclease-4
VDRHALIGQGEIGEDLFRYLVNDRRFKKIPGVLETPIPKGETYRAEVELLKSLVEK